MTHEDMGEALLEAHGRIASVSKREDAGCIIEAVGIGLTSEPTRLKLDLSRTLLRKLLEEDEDGITRHEHDRDMSAKASVNRRPYVMLAYDEAETTVREVLAALEAE